MLAPCGECFRESSRSRRNKTTRNAPCDAPLRFRVGLRPDRTRSRGASWSQVPFHSAGRHSAFTASASRVVEEVRDHTRKFVARGSYVASLPSARTHSAFRNGCRAVIARACFPTYCVQ
ncbi:hypothetical protein C8Q78DRAFT_158507 [Trametes maxima]|nr:hypothetical protein C8Q78DRAFT_158507 [Trametes maxima]